MYVSLKDVAARSGVSFQTASKVLNGRSGVVSPQTRERILAAAREMGYVPNALARGLVQQASLTIGVLVDDIADPALSQFVMAAQRAAGTEGHVALIVGAQPGEDPALAVRKLREHRVGGIIVLAPSLEEDPRLGEALRGAPPVVSLNHVHGGGVSVVGSNHSQTGAAAARHLLSLGHRRIAAITGPRSRRVVRSRHRGFRSAMQAVGAPLPTRLVAAADWTSSGGYAAVNLLLEVDPAITAFFVHGDVMAVGVVCALHDNGLRVPEDYSVASCDDLPVASYVIPALTSVHVPFQETGDRAARLLLQLIRGETAPRQVLLPTHLVVRKSTGPVRARSRPRRRELVTK